jgi:hypothetical protein
VSGEILLLDGPGGSASRLVGALHTLTEEVPSSEFALIGGLAVMTRLGRVHRVTDDLDAAAQSVDGGPSRLSVLVGGESGRARHPIGGVKVDCIDVGSIPAADLDPGELPEDQYDRAFILAHRWALDLATPASLTVVSGKRAALATVSCRVATPAALVAMKLQSAPRRRAERAHKGPNDYGDLYALFTRPESLAGIAADLPGAPHGFGEWCAQRIELEFVTGAARTARAIRQAMLADPPTPADIESTGREVLRRIEREWRLT